MQYVRYNYIKSDSHDIPDAEVFTVYRENGTWAFAMRINNQFTLTRFQDNNVDADGVRAVKKQILFCKNYGWSYTGQKTWNTEHDDHEAEFSCMYCKRTTYDTSQPCPCRNKTSMDFAKKTKSGIILPF
jgi:hypothetical protein